MRCRNIDVLQQGLFFEDRTVAACLLR